MLQASRVHGASRWSGTVLIVFVAMVGCIVDQVTKQWALASLSPGQIRPMLGSFISLQLVFNPGAAFSFLPHATWVFTVISTVVCVAIILFSRRVTSRLWALTLGFLLGGAAGNLIDRLVRPPAFASGHVIDFLNWNGWFTGNVADIWIVGAAIAACVLALFSVPTGHFEGDQ